MEVITDDMTGYRLRRRAIVFWIISGVLIIVTVGSILFYRNPWLVHRMDADQATAEVLEEIAESTSPYVKIEGIELTFTGYYKVNGNGTVCSFCYMGSIGNHYVLTDIPAKDKGALAEDSTLEEKVLKNYTLTGQLVKKDEITARLAEEENMDLSEYKAYYHMADIEIHDYDSDQEKMRIYQMMYLIMAVGVAAAGAILWSESRLSMQSTKDNS